MDTYGKSKTTLVQDTSRLHNSMAVRKQGRKGSLVIDELEEAKKAADYWRNKYDELLKHIEHQNQYRKYLEREVFGGPTF